MRRLLGSARPATALALALTLSSGGVGAHAAAVPATRYELWTVRVPGGMVRGQIRTAGHVAASFVAREGSTVKASVATAPDGTSSITAIGIAPPRVTSHEDTLRMAAGFQEGLGQVARFARDAGIPFEAAPYSAREGGGSGCGPTAAGDPCESLPAVKHDVDPLMQYVTSAVLLYLPDSVGQILLETAPVSGGGGGDLAGGALLVAPVGSDPAETASAAPTSEIWDSGCADIPGSDATWHGCYTRWTVGDSDGSYWYSGDQSQSTGHGSWWYQLNKGDTEHYYAHGPGTVVRWAPGSRQSDSDKCHAETMSLSFYGATLTDTHQVCKDYIDPHIENAVFRAEWHGITWSAPVEATAQDFVRVPNGQSDRFEYWIHISYKWGP